MMTFLEEYCLVENFFRDISPSEKSMNMNLVGGAARNFLFGMSGFKEVLKPRDYDIMVPLELDINKYVPHLQDIKTKIEAKSGEIVSINGELVVRSDYTININMFKFSSNKDSFNEIATKWCDSVFTLADKIILPFLEIGGMKDYVNNLRSVIWFKDYFELFYEDCKPGETIEERLSNKNFLIPPQQLTYKPLFSKESQLKHVLNQGITEQNFNEWYDTVSVMPFNQRPDEMKMY